MSKPVSWTERLPDGVKREVRVTFLGARDLRWQSLRSDAEGWVYDFPPSAEDWEALTERIEARYRRRSASLKQVELVRRLRKESGL
ncbi:MAG: hypothetical protein KBA51_00500 [Kiritimatiellae bacterium]|nr:hypothetical protein [Kiritimatiellia bacterium]